MPFAYYNKLSKKDKAIYRQSAAIETVPLVDLKLLQQITQELQATLPSGQRKKVEDICNKLVAEMVTQLNIPSIVISVLKKRPSDDWGELQGYYEPLSTRKLAKITVWMRTAQREQIVAFKTFLRTLLHEVCHHLDYEYFMLADSFHTEGFYKRESSLFYQLVQ